MIGAVESEAENEMTLFTQLDETAELITEEKAVVR
jgi:hypothetical protein